MTDGKLLSLPEAAAACGESPRTLRYAAQKGNLEATQLGSGAWVTTAAAVARWRANPVAHRVGRPPGYKPTSARGPSAAGGY